MRKVVFFKNKTLSYGKTYMNINPCFKSLLSQIETELCIQHVVNTQIAASCSHSNRDF